MIIILIFAVLAVWGYFLKDHRDYDLIGVMVLAFSLLFIVIALIGIPVNRMEYQAEIARYDALKYTIEQTTREGSNLENATLTISIAEMNQNIASAKYYNTTIFKLWIYDEFTELEYLK